MRTREWKRGIYMDSKKLWLKISGSINYYLQYYSKRMTNEELLKDYVEYALPDMEGDGVHTYLDKQTLERVVVDDEMMEKAKTAFMERLEKRRAKEVNVKEENRVLANVIDISKYRK
ncbi:hypothetical protein LEQ06_18760 [Paraclostridium sp. AKS46]|nr:hypothetical protein [Paraclostridium sp. AKS46]